MQALDAAVAVVVGSTSGALVYKTVRAWHRFRVQERAADLMSEAVRYLEEPPAGAPTRAKEKR